MSTGSASSNSSSCSSIDFCCFYLFANGNSSGTRAQSPLGRNRGGRGQAEGSPVSIAVSFAPRPAPVPDYKQVTPEEQAEADERSVYVGNVDYSCSDEDLKAHFLACGSVTRVTIPRDRFKGTPKGFAYIEFADSAARIKAVAMAETVLKGRQIKVTEKRTNVRGISSTNRFPSFNKVNRMHGGAIVKPVPAYGAAKSVYKRVNSVQRHH